LSEQTKAAYGTAFFDEVADGTRESAQLVVPVVNELVRPASVLDVGCATGTWLAEWGQVGVQDLLGIDGDYVDRTALKFPVEQFKPVDLSRPFNLDRKFDLVQTLEVAEHLDETCADTFVQSLARHSDTILFSAAIPGQGGTHHVNERWQSYWAEKFEKAGYTGYDVIRPRFWTDSRVQYWYRQNMLLFARGRSFGDAVTSFDLVHPEMWESGRTYKQIFRNAPIGLARFAQRTFGGRRSAN
jgi:SAM-dependent methyltransferase